MQFYNVGGGAQLDVGFGESYFWGGVCGARSGVVQGGEAGVAGEEPALPRTQKTNTVTWSSLKVTELAAFFKRLFP